MLLTTNVIHDKLSLSKDILIRDNKPPLMNRSFLLTEKCRG